MDIGGGVGGSLKGGVTHLAGVSGTLSASSTCGIPPGDAGVTLLVGVSLHGDSHTFRFLLDRVSRAEDGCC